MAFKGVERGQGELFPPQIGDLVAEEHPARVVLDLLGKLDFTAFEARYSPIGQRAYPPSVMLAILLYGMIRRVRAARKLADMCRDDIPMRWLTAGLCPDFRTIADFRKNHRDDIAALLAQAAQLAIRLGVLKHALWATDGSVIKASARTSKNADREAIEHELAALKQYMSDELFRAHEADQDDDETFGEDDDGSGIPLSMTSAAARKAALEKALQELKDTPKRKHVHPSDPDAVLIKRNKKTAEVAYNGQITVDTESGLIVAADATSEVTDRHQLMPQLALARENTGLKPDAIVADKGYSGVATLVALEDAGVIAHVPQQKTPSQAAGENGFTRDDYTFDEELNVFTCPHGKTLKPHKSRLREGIRYQEYRANEHDCAACPLASRCLKKNAKARTISVCERADLVEAAKARAKSPEGRAAAKARRCSVEGGWASIKHALGLRQFNLRSRAGARCELAIAALAHNAKKLAAVLATLNPA